MGKSLEMTKNILIYSATGHTGKLIAREALAKGLDLPWRAFDLADRARLAAALKGVAVVLNAAGPFSATARPIAAACLKAGAHYLDITGEIDVFEALFARDAEAKR